MKKLLMYLYYFIMISVPFIVGASIVYLIADIIRLWVVMIILAGG